MRSGGRPHPCNVGETTEHYETHLPELKAILETAR
jgi:hypothetical protein